MSSTEQIGAVALSALGRRPLLHRCVRQLSRIVYDADDPAGARALPDEQSLNRGVMFGGRLHLPPDQAGRVRGETALLDEAGEACCQWRVRLCSPGCRCRLTAHSFWEPRCSPPPPSRRWWTAKTWLHSAFARASIPLGLPFLRWGLPCPDNPYATLSILIVPELGMTSCCRRWSEPRASARNTDLIERARARLDGIDRVRLGALVVSTGLATRCW